jgi:hypothetical protein
MGVTFAVAALLLIGALALAVAGRRPGAYQGLSRPTIS